MIILLKLFLILKIEKIGLIVLKNFFPEYLKKYYSGLTDCIETDDIFMLAGGIDNTIIVISKRCLSGEENSELSAFFKREMVKQYRRARGRKKGKKT